MNKEQLRLDETSEQPWKKWGPYLSERQWGTVREDYSDSGDAWEYFSHDQARSRAYRWGEDGLAGFSDDKQQLCFALSLWNGRDSIIKERLFGLTNTEGNHGEDVKEYYFYLDSTPTHSYMKYLYKYPQDAYPYVDLVTTNRGRSRSEFEYELVDTGVFDQDRYFDVFVEYAKASAEDILIRITAHNRGPEPSVLHVLPTLWFRNTWSWSQASQEAPRPTLRQLASCQAMSVIQITHQSLGARYLYCAGAPELLFTDNETNEQRIFSRPNRTRYVKDGINDFVVHNQEDAINPEKTGTKAAAHHHMMIGAGEARVIRLRLTTTAPSALPQRSVDRDPFGARFERLIQDRIQDSDEFYDSITPPNLSEDERRVMRQALAGMLWTKQYYHFDLDTWLKEHGVHPLISGSRAGSRNKEWFHMLNDDIISMPDKWEYPWYAAWDLAFHTTALAAVDIDFARQQLDLMLHELYLHPSGQIPAYEWNFGDVNPPVHAWAAMFIYRSEKQRRNKGDVEFLKRAFHKLMMNFTWWVNRKDPAGRNVFEGGFLGLDNIGVFDRSSPLPTGGHLEQADGTAWMALFCQNMLEIALELARHDSSYEALAIKFVEHFFWIAAAMDRVGEQRDEMWDEEDGFFYDLLRLPDGRAARLKVRSLVGLLPLCAATVLPPMSGQQFPTLLKRAGDFLSRHPELTANISDPSKVGAGGRRLLAIFNEEKLRRVLTRMLDETEFLSPYGIRSISRFHREHPYVINVHEQEFRVDYMPAESTNAMFGGNSNWRGPIWFPINILLIRALLEYYSYYGDDFKIECPTGSGRLMTLFEVSRELSQRLTRIFLRDEQGRRPVYGGTAKFQTDPHWRDHILFYEYFHGDNGAGLGASHQTGWPGVVARLIQIFASLNAEDALEGIWSRRSLSKPEEETAAASG